jgi:hypothetical protein
MNIPPRIAARLVRDTRTGCLIWTGPTNEWGYGIVWWKGRRDRVHRVIFELAYGRPPRPGFETLHSCDNRLCAEYTHLSEGTKKDNAQDRHRKGRTRGCCGPKLATRRRAA